jgi:hypothetical protein
MERPMGEAPLRFKSKAATELSTPPLIATTMGPPAKMVSYKIRGFRVSLFTIGNDEHHDVLTDPELGVPVHIRLVDSLTVDERTVGAFQVRQSNS